MQFQVPGGIVLIKPYGTMAFGMFSFVHARAPGRTLKVKLTSRILPGPMFQHFWPQLVWTGTCVRAPFRPPVVGRSPELPDKWENLFISAH